MAYRLLVIDTYAGGPAILTLQFYGRELSVSVPTMTGNTTPYGESSCSNSNTDAYKAFDGNDTTYVNLARTSPFIQYQFTNPIIARKAKLRFFNDTGASSTFTANIKGSNDGATWSSVLGTVTTETVAQNQYSNWHGIDLSNSKPYLYYRAECDLSASSGGIRVATLQFYGLDYSEKEFEAGTTKKWLYDHGVELETIDLTGYSQTGQTTDGTAIKNDDSISQSVVAGSKVKIIGSNALIDLTPYSVLRMKLRPKTTLLNANFGVLASKVFNDDTIAGINYSSSWSLALGVDISSINSNYYLYSRLYGSNGSTTMAQAIDIDEWWLE